MAIHQSRLQDSVLGGMLGGVLGEAGVQGPGVLKNLLLIAFPFGILSSALVFFIARSVDETENLHLHPCAPPILPPPSPALLPHPHPSTH